MNSEPTFKYKIRLSGGRVIGPIPIGTIRELITTGKAHGDEQVRRYPDREWKPFSSYPELVELVLVRATESAPIRSEGSVADGDPATKSALSQTVPVAPIIQIQPANLESIRSGVTSTVASQSSKNPVDPGSVVPAKSVGGPSLTKFDALSEIALELGTQKAEQIKTVQANAHSTVQASGQRLGPDQVAQTQGALALAPSQELVELDESDSDREKFPASVPPPPPRLANEQTVIFATDEKGLATAGGAGAPAVVQPGEPTEQQDDEEGSELSSSDDLLNESAGPIVSRPRKNNAKRAKLFTSLAAISFGLILYTLFFEADDKKKGKPVSAATNEFRPLLPSPITSRPEPAASTKLYSTGLQYYVQDTYEGYKKAAQIFLGAASLDRSNVKALALLTSSYINLIDAIPKDENYFNVLMKLFDMIKAKKVELPETVIADVEFYVTTNRSEAAQNVIVEFTKSHASFELEMFYYLAYAYFQQGDINSAARFIMQIPDNKAFSPKVFYLRGQIAEKTGDPKAAIQQYIKALQMNPRHARSRLRICEILQATGSLSKASIELNNLIAAPELLAPKQLASAYMMRALLSGAQKNWEGALEDASAAVALDPENEEYRLEFYTFKAKSGDGSAEGAKEDAKMYFHLAEGERLLKQGNAQVALLSFLRARQVRPKSPIPLVKIGDMFRRQNDLNNARINYKLATDRAPQNIEVWSKYIQVLIASYEWTEAQTAMDRFRKLPVNQSAIDKAAADLYAKQGRWVEAQYFYKRALSRNTIDPDSYVAYAKALLETGAVKEAPFYFALAQRLDPLNLDALVGTARAIANTDSVDRAIKYLQDEMQKGSYPKSQVLSAIVELQIQKGDYDGAKQNIAIAKSEDRENALPYKYEGQLALATMEVGTERISVQQALEAFKSYSDRNPSDPSGYFERYKLLLKKGDFSSSNDELEKIYSLYPKYPNLHFYKGKLYAVQGNRKAAAEEYQAELKNNPNNAPAWIELGKELTALGDINQALGAYTKAMGIDPRSSEAKGQAGWANYLLKNYGAAIALYQAALSLDQGNSFVFKRLGLALKAAGDPAGAARAFKRYLELEPDAPDRAEFETFL